MAKARDLLGRSGAGGFVPPPPVKKVDLTPLDEVDEGEKKQDTKPHADKGANVKGQTKGGGGPTTSIRPKV
jgi:hypothetical protein